MVIPEDWKHQFVISDNELHEELILLTDAFTDELFTFPDHNFINSARRYETWANLLSARSINHDLHSNRRSGESYGHSRRGSWLLLVGLRRRLRQSK
jgi:hypothetical protein